MDDKKQQPDRTFASKLIRGAIVASAVAISVGCLSRPVAGLSPTTKTNFNTVVKQQAVDKIDLLFAIDNSRSMGDKQKLLAQAVPDLIDRLLTPDCFDNSVNPPVDKGPPDAMGNCADPAKLEFQPVYDMHIGIVTSSLGGGGAEQTGGSPICPASAVEPFFNKYNGHNDDKGHLINRVRPTAANSTGVEDTVPNAIPVDGTGGNFLAWLPAANPKNAGKCPGTACPNVPVEPDKATLETDFTTLVVGTQEYGCGLEAQMESWYRFLVQPDPYDSIQIVPDPAGGPSKATLVGTDATLLKQRHDFLRPDSLVAVVMMTDEEDSWSDPLAVGGRGWVTRATGFPGSPTGFMPMGTSFCNDPIDINNPLATGPNDPNCTSCGFAGNMANGTPIAMDPNCQTSCGAGCAGYYTGKDDNLNIRYVNDMKRRYGLDPQFPVSRYVNGLKSLHVPSRDGEHPGGGGAYKGANNCVNPLFAKTLPTDPMDNSLCDPAQQASGLGPRSPDLVYFAIIGGLPWQLLYDPMKAGGAGFKDQLTPDDWQKIIGEAPAHFNLTGIDPHMIESYLPRVSANIAQIPYLGSSLPPPTSGDTTDPFNGREWDTTLSPLKLDLQYACTFTLPTPKDCSDPTVCASSTGCACDCIDPENKPGGAPLCGPGMNGNSKQIRGKAYPTIRELRVAHDLGTQAIVASLCPKEPTDTTSADYGYRPAVRQIIDRLKNSLAGQCLPQALTLDQTGAAPCLILETLPQGTQAGTCDPTKGLNQPDPGILNKYNEQRCADAANAGVQGDAGGGTNPCPNPDDPEGVAMLFGPVCEVTQLVQPGDYTGTCETVTKPGWCYVVGTAAGGCPQAIKFSATGQPSSGAKISLQCIESRGVDGG